MSNTLGLNANVFLRSLIKASTSSPYLPFHVVKFCTHYMGVGCTRSDLCMKKAVKSIGDEHYYRNVDLHASRHLSAEVAYIKRYHVIVAVGVIVFMVRLSWRLSMVTVIGLPIITCFSSVYGNYYQVWHIHVHLSNLDVRHTFR